MATKYIAFVNGKLSKICVDGESPVALDADTLIVNSVLYTRCADIVAQSNDIEKGLKGALPDRIVELYFDGDHVIELSDIGHNDEVIFIKNENASVIVGLTDSDGSVFSAHIDSIEVQHPAKTPDIVQAVVQLLKRNDV